MLDDERPLTNEDAGRLFATARVRELMHAYNGKVVLHFDEKKAQMSILLLKGAEAAERQDMAHSLLAALVGEAQKLNIPLTVDHFQIIDEGTPDGNPMSGAISISSPAQELSAWQVEWRRQLAEKQAAALRDAQPFAARRLNQDFDEMSRRSLGWNALSLISALERELGAEYSVSLVLADGKPVIDLTSTDLVTSVLERFGLRTPETDQHVARGVMHAFNEVLGREPERGDIVIGGTRLADTKKIELAGRETARDPDRKKPERGQGGAALGM